MFDKPSLHPVKVTPVEPLMRLEIELPSASVSMLDCLRISLDIGSPAEVIQRGLQCLAVIMDHGGRFYVEEADGRLQPITLKRREQKEEAS